jgi:protein-tyrosine phosphatase
MAEALFRHHVGERGLDDRFEIESAGTGGWHVGESPDVRMRQTARRRGIRLEGQARQVTGEELEGWDHIVCMDTQNHREVLAMGAPSDRVHLMLDFHPDRPMKSVPDPYYGGARGFEVVFDLVDAAASGLLNHLEGR